MSVIRLCGNCFLRSKPLLIPVHNLASGYYKYHQSQGERSWSKTALLAYCLYYLFSNTQYMYCVTQTFHVVCSICSQSFFSKLGRLLLIIF